jgi:hypothetical protein
MEYQHPKSQIEKFQNDIPKRNITSWTLIDFFFVCLFIAEMMIGVMMKMMLKIIVCTNMKNIYILKSYINVI